MAGPGGGRRQGAAAAAAKARLRAGCHYGGHQPAAVCCRRLHACSPGGYRSWAARSRGRLRTASPVVEEVYRNDQEPGWQEWVRGNAQKYAVTCQKYGMSSVLYPFGAPSGAELGDTSSMAEQAPAAAWSTVSKRAQYAHSTAATWPSWPRHSLC